MTEPITPTQKPNKKTDFEKNLDTIFRRIFFPQTKEITPTKLTDRECELLKQIGLLQDRIFAAETEIIKLESLSGTALLLATDTEFDDVNINNAFGVIADTITSGTNRLRTLLLKSTDEKERANAA